MKYKRELSVAAAFGALLLTLAVVNPAFFAAANLRAIALKESATLAAAVGMTLVILARQIDISIGSQFSICGVVAALLGKSGFPLPVVALGTLAAGAWLGALNGALVAFLRLPSIVVTLATMVSLEAALKWERSGEAIRNVPETFYFAGLGQAGGQALIVAASLAVFAAFAWGLRYLSAGRAVYAVGSDLEAARLAGLRPARVVFSIFVLMGVLTALAALLTAIQFRTIQPNEGKGLEMKVIAAVVVGGVAISGGRGTLAGTLLGTLFLGSIGTALAFLRAESYWERAIQGAIILVAVASDALNLRKKAHAGASVATP
ncbi:MAG TPA: ABC transporter permease [Planctomycetota bacterium]